MSDGGSREAKPLMVRTRQVVGAQRRSTDATVRCPRRDTSIPATECLVCADGDGVMSRSGRTYMRCDHPSARQAAYAELARQPLFASPADRTPLSEVMTGDVICVLPDLGLDEVIQLLLDHDIGGAPVVDDSGRAIGVVSRSDLIGSFQAGATVADVMMPMAFLLPESATLSQAAALMAFEGVHRIPVVSSEGGVVGILSSLDVARWLARNDGYIEPGSNNLVRRAREVR
jgi:CBS domain-containing protein